MRKQCLSVVLVLLCHICIFAQDNNPTFSHTTATANPEIYGNQGLINLVNGDNLKARGKFEEAVIAYDNAIEIDPFFAEAYIKRGLLKYTMGRVQEADIDFKIANSINPYAVDLFGSTRGKNKLRVLAFNPYQWLLELSLSDRTEYYEAYYEDQQIAEELEII